MSCCTNGGLRASTAHLWRSGRAGRVDERAALVDGNLLQPVVQLVVRFILPDSIYIYKLVMCNYVVSMNSKARLL